MLLPGRGCLRVHELTRLCFVSTRAAQRLMLRAKRPSMCGSRTRTPSRRAVLQQEASSTGEWALAGSRRLRRRSFTPAGAVGTGLLRWTDNVVGVGLQILFSRTAHICRRCLGLWTGVNETFCGRASLCICVLCALSVDFGHILCELCRDRFCESFIVPTTKK